MLLWLWCVQQRTVPISWLQPVGFYLYWHIVWKALLLLHRRFLWRWSISLQPLKWICSEGLWQGPWNWWRRRPLSRGRLIKMTCCSVTFPAQESHNHWQCRHTTQDWSRVEATKVEQQPSWRQRFWVSLKAEWGAAWCSDSLENWLLWCLWNSLNHYLAQLIRS